MRIRSNASRPPAGPRGGFQLLDLLISSVLLIVAMGGITQVFVASEDLVDSEDAVARKVDDANRSLARIMADMKYSAFITSGGVDFPALFEDGLAGPGLNQHNHAVPNLNGQALAAREVVFLRLFDGDGDGIPDLDANGDPIWDPAEYSYVLTPTNNGSNRIERRVDGVLDRVIARDVDSFLVDDAVSSGFQVPLGTLRFTLTLSRTGPHGRELSETVVGLLVLRNGNFQ